MARYYQRTTNEAVGYTSATFEHQLLTTTSSAEIESVSIPSLASGVPCFTFIVATGPGVADWPASSYAAQIDVTSATSISIEVRFHRVSSDAATHRYGFGPLPVTGTGLKSFTGNGTYNSPATRTASDRFVFEVRGTSTDMMSAQALALRLNTTDSYVDLPWDVGDAGGLSPPVAPQARRRQHRIGR